MTRTGTKGHGGGYAAPAVYCACAAYLYCLGALVAWVALPLFTGLTPTLIISGSMAPTIAAGDIVLIGNAADEELRAGDVVTFDDPATPGRLLTHRIAGVQADGTIRTRGDANASEDSTSIRRSHIRGVGRVLVPAVGMPLVWIRAHAWLHLALWMGGTVIAGAYLRAHDRVLPRLEHWSIPFATMRQRTASGEPRKPRPRWAAAGAGTLVVVALAAPRLVPSEAAFATTTDNPGNALAASSTFCAPGVETLYAVADARVTDTITTPAGAAVTLGVRNKNNAERTLLDFDVPQAAGCTVTAALRLWTTTGQTGQTLRARAAAGAWTEAAVVWSNQPSMTGPTADRASVASGWVEFDVSAFIADLAAGATHGFVVHDAAEGAGGPPKAQEFSAREAATNRPELVLTRTVTASPVAPSGLSATALSSTRVALSWTDNGGGADGFRVERSTAGGAWEIVNTLGAGTTSYTDTGLQPSTLYDYRVRAAGTSGVSPPSNVATTTTLSPPPAPVAPTGLTAVATGVDAVALSWQALSTDEDGFDMQRSPAGLDTWTAVTTTAPDATGFTDTGLAAGTAYDYRVRATNGGGVSAWSAVASATTSGCATLPSETLISVADSTIFSGTYAATNFGSDASVFYIYSLAGTNGRSLVRFATPTRPGGCAITAATLRLNISAPTAGRTLQAHRVAAPWNEMTVTWNTQPATSGVPVTTTSAAGWVQWDVTSLLGSAGTGMADGIMLRDAAEDAATAQSQLMSPREGANPPQLVVRFD